MDGSFGGGGTALYPERELWFAQSIFTGVNGSFIDMSAFVQDRGSVLVVVPVGLVAATTISFNTATGDPAANYGAPLLPTSTLQSGGLCDPVVAFQITVGPPDVNYSVTKGQIIRIPIQDRFQFIQPVLSAATPGLAVLVIGKASRLFSL